MTNTAIITAGGSGLRLGSATPKQFLELAGIPVLARTIEVFEKTPAIDQIIVVAPADYLKQTRELIQKFQLNKVRRVVSGGKERQDSVKAGLDTISEKEGLVIVHDGVRPFITASIIENCINAAHKSGAALAAVPVSDTIKEANKDATVRRTIDRSCLFQAQTPQVVEIGTMRRAMTTAETRSFIGTDEASLLEEIGIPMTMVEGSERNIKITRPEDLVIAEALLMKNQQKDKKTTPFRIGHGYDAHCLVEGRPLILGGVRIDHSHGLLGHSDADVLTHALCDALLGAMAEGDIGRHFPDSDPNYKNINSIKLLCQVMELAREKGLGLVNADITIIAQEPKLAPHFPAMLANLTRACACRPDQINLKATTSEEMGFTGRREGMAGHAVVMLAG